LDFLLSCIGNDRLCAGEYGTESLEDTGRRISYINASGSSENESLSGKLESKSDGSMNRYYGQVSSLGEETGTRKPLTNGW